MNALHPCPPHKGGTCHHSSSSSGSSSGGSSNGGSSNGKSSSSTGGGGYNADGSYNSDGSGSYNADGSYSGSSSNSNSNGNNKNGNGGGGGGGDDDKYADMADDAWSADGYGDDQWQESELGRGSGAGGNNSAATNIGPFLLGALAAGIIGAALMVTRKRRQEQEENHPLEGSLKKRMKLFNGGVFRKKKGPTLNGEIAGAESAPAFIEISSIRSGISRGGGDDMSVKSGVSKSAGSYKAPAEPAIFENESDDSDDL